MRLSVRGITGAEGAFLLAKIHTRAAWFAPAPTAMYTQDESWRSLIELVYSWQPHY
jgi:hypothetical protein